MTAWLNSLTPVTRRALSATLLLVVIVAMLPARDALNILNVGFIFMIAVIGIALLADRWASAVAALVAFLAFDFFFVQPYRTLTVARGDHVLALFVFLGVALLTSELVYRVRLRTEDELRRGRQMATLYQLSQALITDSALRPLLAGIVEAVREQFSATSCTILMPDDDNGFVVGARASTAADVPARDDDALIRWTFENQQLAGIGGGPARVVQPHGSRAAKSFSIPRRSASSLYVPIVVTRHSIGVMKVTRPPNQKFSTADQQLLLTFANQAALAIQRASLTEEATRAEVLARSDDLKSTLLSAVSHDLRTPLASIKAAVTSLLQEEIAWSEEDERDLLLAINEETDRLARIIGNLLDLTRIEAGVLRPQLEWNDVDELIRVAVAHMKAEIADRPVHLDIANDLPDTRFDFVEMEQVIVNLIENALKYSPPASPITIRARQVADDIEVCVHNAGPSIPSHQIDKIFDRFQRLADAVGTPGTGIGLAICSGIVKAHGGTIWVDTDVESGAQFCFTLPVADQRTPTDTKADIASGCAR